jgi:hypothetical protein
MDRMTKLFLGRILGEVYRLQRRQDPKMVPVDAATIYGLLKGFEWVVDALFKAKRSGVQDSENCRGGVHFKGTHRLSEDPVE